MSIHIKRKPVLRTMAILILTVTLLIYTYELYFLTIRINRKMFSTEWFRNCLNEFNEFDLENLPNYIKTLRASRKSHCNELSTIFDRIFTLEELNGELMIPNEYEEKVKSWLNNEKDALTEIKNQKIMKLYNKYMHEEMIYNPLRGKRPQPKETEIAKNYTYDLLKESMKDCDFCDERYKSNTAYDTFGRMETKYSYTAANTFKYDKWHSLIVSRNHDTLNLNEIETIDMFDLALKWFDKVNKIDNNAKYPEILWDAMPKSGASQIHTHLQASMGINSYYGGIQRLQSASKLYYNEFNRDYIDDFILVHQALGLSLLINKTYVILNLIPIKEHEVMIINADSQPDEEYFKILHVTISSYLNSLRKYSFSMGMFLPDYTTSGSKLMHLNNRYTICRIVFRMPVTNLRSDMNGLDLFTSSVLNIDRYKIASKLFPVLKDVFKML